MPCRQRRRPVAAVFQPWVPKVSFYVPVRWDNRNWMNSLGVYVSVPFCRAKCSYCNFASGVSSVSAHEQYVARVCADIRSARRRLGSWGADVPEQVDSIYLGGGTPSVLSPALLRELAHTLRQEFAIAPAAEITL